MLGWPPNLRPLLLLQPRPDVWPVGLRPVPGTVHPQDEHSRRKGFPQTNLSFLEQVPKHLSQGRSHQEILGGLAEPGITRAVVVDTETCLRNTTLNRDHQIL